MTGESIPLRSPRRLPPCCRKCRERKGAFCGLYAYDLELRAPVYSCRMQHSRKNKKGYDIYLSNSFKPKKR